MKGIIDNRPETKAQAYWMLKRLGFEHPTDRQINVLWTLGRIVEA